MSFLERMMRDNPVGLVLGVDERILVRNELAKGWKLEFLKFLKFIFN